MLVEARSAQREGGRALPFQADQHRQKGLASQTQRFLLPALEGFLHK